MKKEHKCKFCNKEFDTGVKLGGHVVRCKLNPNYKESSIKHANSVRKKRIIIKTICKKCNKEFEQIIIENGCSYIKEFCSRSCANSRIRTDDIKKKIRDGLSKSIKITHKKEFFICKKCGIVFRAVSRNAKFCSQKCVAKYHEHERNINLTEYQIYRKKCQFKFNVYKYPDYFDIELLNKHGWYSAKNRGNNFDGICRDHIYSIKMGWDNKISSDLISHPVNCNLIKNIDNLHKNIKCEITIDELKNKIKDFNIKYPLI